MSKSSNASTPTELRSRAEQMAQWLVAPPLNGELDAYRLMHELQVHQVELEMQNAELRHARTEMDAALQKANDDTAQLRMSGVLTQMCDDMHAPLNIIADMSQQLRQLGVNAEQTKRLDQLDNASTTLQRIILASIKPGPKPARERVKKAK